MVYPILAAQDGWYKSTAAKTSITKITIVNSYAPTGNEDENWNADVDNSGSIKCYRTGTEIIIAGNGSGKIACNADSTRLFSGNVTSATNVPAFINVEAITGTNLLDTSNVTSLNSAFAYCLKLKTIDVGNWNVENVTNMRMLFGANPAVGQMMLENIDVGKWNTSSVQNMRQTFYACSSLTHLDVSNWDVSNVTDMNRMFSVCSSIEKLDVSRWNTSNVTDMTCMFYDESYGMAMKELDFSNWDTSKVTSMTGIFDKLTNLEKITIGEKFSFDANGSITDSIKFAVLPTPNGNYITGADGKWYTAHYDSYVPSNVPDLKKNTYYASKDLVDNLNIIVKNYTMKNIADAIRFKNGLSNKYTPDKMAEAILNLV